MKLKPYHLKYFFSWLFDYISYVPSGNPFISYAGFGFWTVWDETQANKLKTVFLLYRAKKYAAHYGDWLNSQ